MLGSTIGNYFKYRKYKKMIKGSSTFILEEFAIIINETIEHFERESQIKSSQQREMLKFEGIALAFWFFQINNAFPGIERNLLLDEIHNQYYERLKKNGYNSAMRQLVCDDFNLRYKTYNEAIGINQDFTQVGTKFVRFFSEKSKTDLDPRDMIIPVYLIQKLIPKFEEFSDARKGKKM